MSLCFWLFFAAREQEWRYCTSGPKSDITVFFSGIDFILKFCEFAAKRKNREKNCVPQDGDVLQGLISATPCYISSGF